MNTARRIIGFWCGANIRGTAAAVRAGLAGIAETEQRAAEHIATAARELARVWQGRPASEGIEAAASRVAGHLSHSTGNVAACESAATRAAELEASIASRRASMGPHSARLALGVAARLAALSHDLRAGNHVDVLPELCALAERLPKPSTGEEKAERAISELSTLAAAVDVEGGR